MRGQGLRGGSGDLADLEGSEVGVGLFDGFAARSAAVWSMSSVTTAGHRACPRGPLPHRAALGPGFTWA
ncbi:hypothetical protein [Streptomyces massasporeus]|uniref:hypothetical protein n=1 Tax=Streptomyces massasporeus TaxID=67324 RepID=UPI0033302C68